MKTRRWQWKMLKRRPRCKKKKTQVKHFQPKHPPSTSEGKWRVESTTHWKNKLDPQERKCKMLRPSNDCGQKVLKRRIKNAAAQMQVTSKNANGWCWNAAHSASETKRWPNQFKLNDYTWLCSAAGAAFGQVRLRYAALLSARLCSGKGYVFIYDLTCQLRSYVARVVVGKTWWKRGILNDFLCKRGVVCFWMSERARCTHMLKVFQKSTQHSCVGQKGAWRSVR